MKFKTIFLYGFWVLIFFVLSSVRASAETVWDVIRDELSLNHELSEPAVQSQLRWLVSHPSYLQELGQAKPYIYHIITQIKKRKLPGEIALLPMLESAYDPFAYSGAGAAGLWQLMPQTGNDLGLKRDWWFDARRSIGPSTNAALSYLSYLNHFFNGNWLLAFAAYDAGEGTVSRAMKNQQKRLRLTHNVFWSLRLPHETEVYVPRLLALAEIIKDPKRYHVQLPDIPYIPYFEEVYVGSPIDLNHAAALAGMSYKDLIKLNPGFNRSATSPKEPYNLLIPKNKVEKFTRNLSTIPKNKRASFTEYRVEKDQNIQSIAAHFFTTPQLIRQLNQLNSDTLKTGQVILLPTVNKNAQTNAHVNSSLNHKVAPKTLLTSGKTYKIIHILQSGETLNKVAMEYHTSVTQLKAWNHLSRHDNGHKGQALILWRTSSVRHKYIVQRNDNIAWIARKNKISIQKLIQLNPTLQFRRLKPGDSLFIG